MQCFIEYFDTTFDKLWLHSETDGSQFPQKKELLLYI